MSDQSGTSGSHLVRAIAALLADLWSMVFFTLFAPRANDHQQQADRAQRGEEAREGDRGVTTRSERGQIADDVLETLGAKPHLGGRTREGGAQGSEDDVSDFLKQLEQRTEQVKITLANLEAEKIRIESQINALQPLVPQYDALIEAERSLSQASISFEPVNDGAPPPHLAAEPQESSGWSSDAPGGDEGGEQGSGQQSSGWSGSWNS